MKENFKNNKAYQNSYGERAVKPQRKRGNVTLIHPITYKYQFLIDEVLQCLVDKYQITYQNIWGEAWSDLI